MTSNSMRWLERLLIASGCMCLIAVAINVAAAASFQHAAAEKFERAMESPETPALAEGVIGRLEIPRLKVSMIVMEGDDEETLAQAAGHLRETALPWEQGNAVIAGHRDTFFRPLKQLRDGDAIRMTTTRGTFEYRVVRAEVVEPDDLSALAPTPIRSLTLVTCYPFAYVGPAPQRFIVHAR